jgi:hypothetical protein
MTGMAASPRSEHAPPGLQITAFSDSLCISAPTTPGNPGATLVHAAGVCWLAAHASRELLRLGILIRGGITIGHLYHRGAFAIGRGLVTAYELEQRANFPRILVDPELAVAIEQLPGATKSRLAEQLSPRGPVAEPLLQRDSDGSWMVDTIPRVPSGDSWKADEVTVRQRFKTVAMHLSLQLMAQLWHKPVNENVVGKLRWLIQRFNPELLKLGLGKIDAEDPMRSIINLGPE